jgi:hypothetical protein
VKGLFGLGRPSLLSSLCRAWKRGRRSRTLYNLRELDEALLDLDLAELRARLEQ